MWCGYVFGRGFAMESGELEWEAKRIWDLGLGTWDLGLGTWDLGLGTGEVRKSVPSLQWM